MKAISSDVIDLLVETNIKEPRWIDAWNQGQPQQREKYGGEE